MVRYEEARNQAQEPSSRTKKMINCIQDKAKIAKEDCQDRMRLPVYSTGGDGGGSGPDGDDDGDPTDQDRDSSSEWGGNGFPFRRRGVEEDRQRIQTRRMMMGYLGVSRGDEGPGVIQDPGDQKDLGDPQGRWDPGEFLGDCLPLVWGTRSCHPRM